jgi:hypothetical protein
MGRLAADVRPGESKMIAQKMDKQGSRFDQAFDCFAVHRHGYVRPEHRILRL